MCKAASFIVTRQYKVYFHPIEDSHSDIIKYHFLHEGSGRNQEVNLVPVEICPPKDNLTLPFDQWKFTTDLPEVPSWYDAEKAEKAVRLELPNWYKKLEGIRLEEAYNPVNPFKIKAKRLTKKHKLALKEWAEVCDSVSYIRFSVRYAILDSLTASLGYSVKQSIKSYSVGYYVRDLIANSFGEAGESFKLSTDPGLHISSDSVWDATWGYIGSLFPNIKWIDIKKKNPFNGIRLLWLDGYVPSFDGQIWRLHSGKKAKVVFEITSKELKKLT